MDFFGWTNLWGFNIYFTISINNLNLCFWQSYRFGTTHWSVSKWWQHFLFTIPLRLEFYDIIICTEYCLFMIFSLAHVQYVATFWPLRWVKLHLQILNKKRRHPVTARLGERVERQSYTHQNIPQRNTSIINNQSHKEMASSGLN